ncbi:hypothetical protein NQ318_012606 [Aromia moschata]|uniref:Uncharacterized protein n=1 Tax=Aromia moschata TaxID=1265417 RepID=A0AAV8YJS3_9CUCU|nr:hypothetical protein NQ318_012606 [Aromia moschata]
MQYIVLFVAASISAGCAYPLGSVSSSVSGATSSTAILMPLSNLVETVDDTVGALAKSKTLTPGFPDSGRTVAVLEQKSLESLPIQLDDKYGNLQQFVAGIYNPKPIVDTIQEHEKYGNDGELHRKAANLFVGKVEGLSNGLNGIVELPFILFRQVGKSVTTSLNTVGGKLVGLS